MFKIAYSALILCLAASSSFAMERDSLSISDEDALLAETALKDSESFIRYAKKVYSGEDTEHRFKCDVDYRKSLADAFFFNVNQQREHHAKLATISAAIYFAYRVSRPIDADASYKAYVLQLLSCLNSNYGKDIYNILYEVDSQLAHKFNNFAKTVDFK